MPKRNAISPSFRAQNCRWALAVERGVRHHECVAESAGSLYAVVVAEPDSGNAWRAAGLSLLSTLFLNDTPARLRWRLDLVDRDSGVVLLSWKDSHDSTMVLKKSLERDLSELDVSAFRSEWNLPKTEASPRDETP
jgi:hypothetical protein